MENVFDGIFDDIKVPTQDAPPVDTPPADAAPVDGHVEQVAAPTEPTFDFETLNKTFGTEYKDVDSIKGVFEKASKYDDVYTQKETASRRVAELEAIEEKVNPLNFFSSPDAYLREQFLLKNPDLDPGVLKVVSGLTPTIIKDLSPLKALQAQLLVANPDIEGGEEGVAELVADKYGITVEELGDYASLERSVKNKINLDAKTARTELGKLFDGIDVPQKVDLTQARTEIRTAWESPLKELIKGIDKLSIAKDLDFIVTDDMKAGLFDDRLTRLSNGLVKPSEEVMQDIASDIRTRLLIENMDKVVEVISKTEGEKWKEHYRKEVHNTKPLNEQDRENVAELGFEDWISKY